MCPGIMPANTQRERVSDAPSPNTLYMFQRMLRDQATKFPRIGFTKKYVKLIDYSFAESQTHTKALNSYIP